MKKLAHNTYVKWLVGLLGILPIGCVIYLMPLGRELTVTLLGKTGPLATPLLRQALQDEDHKVRGAAYDALRELGTGAVPSLRRALRDKMLASARGRQRLYLWLAQTRKMPSLT